MRTFSSGGRTQGTRVCERHEEWPGVFVIRRTEGDVSVNTGIPLCVFVTLPARKCDDSNRELKDRIFWTPQSTDRQSSGNR